MVSGKKLSQWTDQLEDRDPEIMRQAIQAIRKVPPAEAERARDPLKKCWPGRPLTTPVIAELAVTRQLLFAEVSPAYFGSLMSALEYGDRDQAFNAAMVLEHYPEHADEIVDRSIKVLTGADAPLWRTLDVSGLLAAFGTQALPKLEVLPEPDDLMTQVAVGSLIERLKTTRQVSGGAKATSTPTPPSTPTPTPTPPDPEAQRLIRVANDNALEKDRLNKRANEAYLVAEQWMESARSLGSEDAIPAGLPPESSLNWPSAPPGTADYYRQLFNYHDARGKAWRARAQALEARRKQSATR